MKMLLTREQTNRFSEGSLETQEDLKSFINQSLQDNGVESATVLSYDGFPLWSYKQLTTTVHPEMSDLFFNHTHDSYSGIGNMATPDLMYVLVEEAIQKDAQNFVRCYPTVCRLFKVTAEQLAADFMRRL